MNCPKKETVLREWRANPDRTYAAIASAAGCSSRYCLETIHMERRKMGIAVYKPAISKREIILREWENTHSCRQIAKLAGASLAYVHMVVQKARMAMPVVQWREPTGGFSVEEWQANRDQAIPSGEVAARGMTKQQTAIYQELQLHPKQLGETAKACSKRVAAVVGCAPITVQQIIHLEKMKQIGIQKREEERAKLVPVLSDGPAPWGSTELEIVRSFRGWRDTFFRLKVVLRTYQYLAKQRECVYADSFLSCMLELCEKGEFRAGKERL